MHYHNMHYHNMHYRFSLKPIYHPIYIIRPFIGTVCCMQQYFANWFLWGVHIGADKHRISLPCHFHAMHPPLQEQILPCPMVHWCTKTPSVHIVWYLEQKLLHLAISSIEESTTQQKSSSIRVEHIYSYIYGISETKGRPHYIYNILSWCGTTHTDWPEN